MSETILPAFNPETDLKLERVIDIPVDLVWQAWTMPEHLKVWFCPKPWSVSDCEIDLRPGGKFYTVMQGPDGQRMPNTGCYLEVFPKRKLVFTDALLPGYRPSGQAFMTAIISMEPQGSGTRYTAIALHANADTRRQHEAMGFETGWGKALDQLVEHMKLRG